MGIIYTSSSDPVLIGTLSAARPFPPDTLDLYDNGPTSTMLFAEIFFVTELEGIFLSSLVMSGFHYSAKSRLHTEHMLLPARFNMKEMFCQHDYMRYDYMTVFIFSPV